MGRAFPADLRWRAVFGIWCDERSYSDVVERLSMGPMTVRARWVKAIWKLFVETGDVKSYQGQRDAPPANRIIDELAHITTAAHITIQHQSPAAAACALAAGRPYAV